MADQTIPTSDVGFKPVASIVVTVTEAAADSEPLDTVFRFAYWGVKPATAGADALGVLVTKSTAGFDGYLDNADVIKAGMLDDTSLYVYNGPTSDLQAVLADAEKKVSTLVINTAHVDIDADYSAFSGAIIIEDPSYGDSAMRWNSEDSYHGQMADINEGQAVYVLSRFLATKNSFVPNKSIQNSAFRGVADPGVARELEREGISYFLKGSDQTILDSFRIGRHDATAFYVKKMIERDLATVYYRGKDRPATRATLDELGQQFKQLATDRYLTPGLIDEMGKASEGIPPIKASITDKKNGIATVVFTYVRREVIYRISAIISDKAAD